MSDYRPKAGDIGCVPMHAPGGPLIRTGELLLRRVRERAVPERAADYQHAFVYVGKINSVAEPSVFQAEPGGARFVPLSRYPADKILWLQRPLSVLQRAQATRLCIALQGTPYSYLDYAAITAHALHLPGSVALRQYVASTKHMICSQLADYIHQMIEDQIFDDGRWPGFVTPMDLAATGEKP